jgi:putative RNA 2'-phosphotransferase
MNLPNRSFPSIRVRELDAPAAADVCMPNDTQISQFMSLVLLHAPHEAGLVLDENGWADFGRLCEVIKRQFHVPADEVRRIVNDSRKIRFSIKNDRIRAENTDNDEADVGLRPMTPPDVLYHGTKLRFLGDIMSNEDGGLRKQARRHVQLSHDVEIAISVARRRMGEDVIFSIDAKAMAERGFQFFLSESDVWLTDRVPLRFLTRIDPETEA